MCEVCFAADPGPAERIGDQLRRLAEPQFARRLGAVRRAVEAAADFDSAARAILDLAARWTPDHLGSLMGEAMELAAWAGREEVFLDGDAAASFATEVVGQEFREQVDFLRQKRPKPTQAWTDAMQGDHDRAFVVAGATDMAMLEDFQDAILRAAETYDYAAFAKDFDQIVDRYGWSYKGGRDWRIRTIFDTNLRTSAMAGRLRQMREVTATRPYWQYIHAETRVPRNPRELHVAWDGMVLRHDDPWWEVYFPPNDWLCSCGVRSLSEADLRRLGKSGPDTAPPILRHPYLHEASGVTYDLPEGTGYGWDYMPGDKWERGLVPSALIAEAGGLSEGRQKVVIDVPEPIEALVAKARPFSDEAHKEVARLKGLPIDTAPEVYVKSFLERFGADIGRGVLWHDKAGTRLPISDELFRDQKGGWKVSKDARLYLTPLLAEALLDPDEIWLGVSQKRDPVDRNIPELLVDRRFLRAGLALPSDAADQPYALMSVFQVGRRWWEGITSHPLTKKNATTADWRTMDLRRGGKLLWRRKV